MKHPAPAPHAYRLGVGLVVFNPRGQVFVAQRLDAPEAWQMPQGGIDKGEQPRQAALREMEEEIGTNNAVFVAESADWHSYDLPADIAAKCWGGKYRGQRQKWFGLLFAGPDRDIDIHTRHPEFSAWRWAEIEDLPALAVGFKRPIYQAVVAEFLPVALKLRAGQPVPAL